MVFLSFLLHSPVLKPDFDLSFAEMQTLGNFDSSSSRQISICDVFAFQFCRLMARVCLASFTMRRDQT